MPGLSATKRRIRSMARKPSSGSVYKPKYRYRDRITESSVWWIKYYVRGVAVRESAHTDSWEEANRLLKKKQGEVVTGRFAGIGAERIKMEPLLKAVELEYEENQRHTLADVQTRNKLHLIPAFGDIRAAEFSTSHIKAYIRSRRKADATNATINRELAVLRRAFRLAAAEDPPLVMRVPLIPRLSEDNVREGFLDTDNYRKLLMELPSRLRLLFIIGYHTGARVGELRNTRIDQVDLKARQILVSRKVTKNKEAHTLPIYGDMAPALEMAIEERNQKFPNCPWLFFDDQGQQIGTFYKAWASACERAGVPGLLFHDLRRSAARNMDRAGIPRKVIMQITGHKTESMFLRYRIVSDRDLKDAAARLDSYMSQSSTQQPVQEEQRQAIKLGTGKELGKESTAARPN
jgi:integrase